MASIMKRGNTYSVRYNYKDHAGKPCKGWETFKTKAEAQERKITVEKELLDGTFLVPDTMTVEEMLYKWIPIQSSKHKWSPKTYTQSVAMVQNLIVPYIGKRKVQDLRTYDIEQFYATLSQTPCGQYVHGEKQELTENQKKNRERLTGEAEYRCFIRKPFPFLFAETLLLPQYRADGKLRSFKKIMFPSAGRRSGSRQQASFQCRIHGRGFYRPTGYRLSVPRCGSPEVSGGSLSTVRTLPCR